MNIKHYTDKRIGDKVKAIKEKKDLNSKIPNKRISQKTYSDNTATFRYSLINSININNIQNSNTKKNVNKDIHLDKKLEYLPSKNTNQAFFSLFLILTFIISSTIVILFIKIKGFEEILNILSKFF